MANLPTTLALASAAQLAPAAVLATFTTLPLAASPTGANDALNPGNWVLSGPGQATVTSVSPRLADPQAVLLFTSSPLVGGSWTLAVRNVQTVFGTALSAPTTATFTATSGIQQMSVAGGAQDDGGYDALRKNFNPALKGPNWDSLLSAAGTGDDYLSDTAEQAADMMNVSSAAGAYLDRRASDVGQTRPKDLGMPDDPFRQLVIKTTTSKLTQQTILDGLEQFYGPAAVRAYAQSSAAEPYALADGQTLLLLLDELLPVTVTFSAAAFKSVSAATAQEVAAAITFQLRLAGSNAWAAPFTDPITGLNRVRIWSAASGLRSGVRVQGGQAQNALLFPQQAPIYLTTTPATWVVTYNAAAGTARYTVTGNGVVDLTQAWAGMYANVYGASFNAANQGTFPITAVSVVNTAGTLTQYFEVQNSKAVPQTAVNLSTAELQIFNPVRAAANNPSTSAVVAQGANLLTVVLPATSQAVSRGPKTAAYLNSAVPVTVTALTRARGGTVTVTAPGHGLAVGGSFILQGVRPLVAAPATTMGNPAGGIADQSVQSLWSRTPNMLTSARRFHTATLLSDGRALILGGETYVASVSTVLATSEMFRILTVGTPGSTGTAVTYERDAGATYPNAIEHHQAALLTDPTLGSKVLVSGGWTGAAYATACQLYTAAPPAGAGSFASTGSLAAARAAHAMAVTGANGQALATGGANGASTLATCELYTPSTGTWAAAGSLNQARCQHQMLLLGTGQVLVIGGRQVTSGASQLNALNPASMGTILATCELAPTGLAAAWSNKVGSMSCARFGHKALLLPSGRVIVLGGWGYPFSQPNATPARLASCEVYDPNTGFWTPAGSMSTPRAFMDAEILTVDGKQLLFVAGGSPTSTATDVLDLATMVWRTTPATLPAARDLCRSVAMQSGTMLYSSSGTDGTGSTSSVTDYLLVPGAERWASGCLNAVQQVASVVDSSHFTFTTQNADPTYMDASQPAQLLAFAAPKASFPGPYLIDPKGASPAVTGTQATTGQDLLAGHTYPSLTLSTLGGSDPSPALRFPNSPGWLCFQHGYSNQVFPIRYLGQLSPTALLLDASYIFPGSVPSGSNVRLLSSKGAWMPDGTQIGAFYLTLSAVGRTAASAMVDAVVAGGVDVDKIVEYPGGNGLGNAGRPDSGTSKISDVVAIWSGDDVDAEVAAARSGG